MCLEEKEKVDSIFVGSKLEKIHGCAALASGCSTVPRVDDHQQMALHGLHKMKDAPTEWFRLCSKKRTVTYTNTFFGLRVPTRVPFVGRSNIICYLRCKPELLRVFTHYKVQPQIDQKPNPVTPPQKKNPAPIFSSLLRQLLFHYFD